MRDVYIIGAFSTAFGKKPETGFKALTREAYAGLLADAGLETGAEIETGWVSNCGRVRSSIGLLSAMPIA